VLLRKRVFSQRKLRKWPLFQDVGIQNFKLFMKNKWWLTSRTTLNTPSKHKKFTIFLLSSEKGMVIKRVQVVGIQTFEVIYEEQVMAHIWNYTKHDFET
jgi:hypothetical protein